MLNFIINPPFVDVNIIFFGDVRKSLVCVVVTGCSELNVRLLQKHKRVSKIKFTPPFPLYPVPYFSSAALSSALMMEVKVPFRMLVCLFMPDYMAHHIIK
jgi:hypothetical protein